MISWAPFQSMGLKKIRYNLISWAPSSPPSASFFTPSLNYEKEIRISKNTFLNEISPLCHLVHIPQHGHPSKYWGHSSRENLPRTLHKKSRKVKIWSSSTWATSLAISLFTFSPKIEPTASSPAIIVCGVNIGRGTTDPWVDTINWNCLMGWKATYIRWKLGQQVAPLALVRIWPPGGSWIVILILTWSII